MFKYLNILVNKGKPCNINSIFFLRFFSKQRTSLNEVYSNNHIMPQYIFSGFDPTRASKTVSFVRCRVSFSACPLTSHQSTPLQRVFGCARKCKDHFHYLVGKRTIFEEGGRFLFRPLKLRKNGF